VVRLTVAAGLWGREQPEAATPKTRDDDFSPVVTLMRPW
jgi:hypothetical protein